MKVGYARVSTDDQNLSLQLDALAAAGCSEVFSDQGVSGAAGERGGLSKALAAVQRGDVLVVWKLDRLGRSVGFLVQLVERLRVAGAGFQSLTDGIDTTSPTGTLVFHIMGALAEFERSLIAERTRAGMTAAKRRGKHVGRPALLSPQQIAHARELVASGRESRSATAALFGVDVKTLRRALTD